MINIGKKVDDISDPVLLPEEWYRCTVCEPAPISRVNNAGTGSNWIINLITQNNIDPEHNGYKLSAFLPMPTEEDEKQFRDGQSEADAKASRLVEWTLGFGGSVTEADDGTTDLEIELGSEAMVYVLNRIDKRSGKNSNSVGIFGEPPKPLLDEEEPAF